MEIIRRLYRQSAFVVIPLALLSAFIEWKKLPISIVLGALLGLLNLKGLSSGIERLIHSRKATMKIVVLTLIRLSVLFSIIIIVSALRLVNILGLVAGFTVVFALLMKEGLKVSSEDASDDNPIN